MDKEAWTWRHGHGDMDIETWTWRHWYGDMNTGDMEKNTWTWTGHGHRYEKACLAILPRRCLVRNQRKEIKNGLNWYAPL
jgi:hypothetical protein